MTREKFFALLVSGADEPFEDLKVLLERVGLDVQSTESCDEAAQLLERTKPALIFTSIRLPDGTWSDVVSLVKKSSAPANVIVVGKFMDTQFYISTMDGGAFDFILPPFEADPIRHVVRVAAENVRQRREEQAIGARA